MQADKGDNSDVVGREEELPVGDQDFSLPEFAPYENDDEAGNSPGAGSEFGADALRTERAKSGQKAPVTRPEAGPGPVSNANEGVSTRASNRSGEGGASPSGKRSAGSAKTPDSVVKAEPTPTAKDDAPAQADLDRDLDAGARLRAARERSGVELSHVAAETRIPIRHLQSIEAGNYDTLPSRTYAIGFAKNYARSVGLDREEIGDLVRAELAADEDGSTAGESKMEPGDPAKLPSSGLVWFGAIAALLLAIGVVAFYSTYFGAGTGPAPLALETEAGTNAGEQAVEDTSAPTTATALADDGQVVFTALDDGVWVRFYEDNGERLFEDTMESGESFEVPQTADAPLINTGRPDLLAITIDGRDVPKLADEPVTMGDVAVSARALLDRGNMQGGDERSGMN